MGFFLGWLGTIQWFEVTLELLVMKFRTFNIIWTFLICGTKLAVIVTLLFRIHFELNHLWWCEVFWLCVCDHIDVKLPWQCLVWASNFTLSFRWNQLNCIWSWISSELSLLYIPVLIMAVRKWIFNSREISKFTIQLFIGDLTLTDVIKEGPSRLTWNLISIRRWRNDRPLLRMENSFADRSLLLFSDDRWWTKYTLAFIIWFLFPYNWLLITWCMNLLWNQVEYLPWWKRILIFYFFKFRLWSFFFYCRLRFFFYFHQLLRICYFWILRQLFL